MAPFPGATTGTGGRIRDVQATGTGSNVVAGTAGYCFGNLNIPGTVNYLTLCRPFIFEVFLVHLECNSARLASLNTEKNVLHQRKLGYTAGV